MTVNRNKEDENMGVLERFHRTTQIKKLTKGLEKNVKLLREAKSEAEIEALRWKSNDSGKKITHRFSGIRFFTIGRGRRSFYRATS